VNAPHWHGDAAREPLPDAIGQRFGPSHFNMHQNQAPMLGPMGHLSASPADSLSHGHDCLGPGMVSLCHAPQQMHADGGDMGFQGGGCAGCGSCGCGGVFSEEMQVDDGMGGGYGAECAPQLTAQGSELDVGTLQPQQGAPPRAACVPEPEEDGYSKFKESIVSFAKPLLRTPYERNEITKEGFKQILKKTADKVVSSYRKEGMPPPANSEIAPNQKAKIQRLVEDYIKFFKGQPS